MLVARDISVRLGKRPILSDLNLDAAPGQLTAIVGPNGSGKTTLLRALTGEIASGGRITLNGRDIRSARGWELAAMRAVLPQSATLAFPFSVRDVVALGLHAGLAAGDAAIVGHALARVDLGRYAHRAYQELSGGEQQRVQLARVLAQVWQPVVDGQPRWLFLDEPVSSLDIGHQLTVMRIAQDFARAGGGVVAVMHDLNLTAMFADRVVMMQSGAVAAAGCVSDVLTDAILTRAYGCTVRVNITPGPGGTFILPHAADAA